MENARRTIAATASPNSEVLLEQAERLLRRCRDQVLTHAAHADLREDLAAWQARVDAHHRVRPALALDDLADSDAADEPALEVVRANAKKSTKKG